MEANMNQRNVAEPTEQHERTPLIIGDQYPAAVMNGSVVSDDDRGES